MTDKSLIPVKTKIWEMANPLVFFFVCMFACILIGYLVAGFVYGLGLGSGADIGQIVLKMSLWCYLAIYAVTIVVKGSRRQMAYERTKYGHESARRKLWQCVLAIAAAFIAAYATSAVIDISGFAETFSTYNTAADATFSGQPAALLILTTVVAGPIAEEIIFRYMVFGRMRFYLGAKAGIVLSALLFGIYHANIVQFVYCTVLGMIFAFIYDRFGNLWVPIGAHVAINFVGILVYI